LNTDEQVSLLFFVIALICRDSKQIQKRDFRMNEPTKIKSEEGYTFYRLNNGRYTDSKKGENTDMS
jgi:hypothetical protein